MKKETCTRRFWHMTDDGNQYLVEAEIYPEHFDEEGGQTQYRATITRVETHCGKDVHPADLPADIREDMEWWALQHDMAVWPGRFFADEHDQAVRYWSECIDAEDQAEREYQRAWDKREAAVRKTKDAKVQLDRIKSIQREHETTQNANPAR